jgi:hypothetical protein
MRRFALGAIAALLFSAGCVSHLPDPNDTVNIDAITYAVLTELYCASKQVTGSDGQPYFASGDNWVALVDLNLSAAIEASANPVVSLLGPFNLARAVPAGGTVGSFTAAFGGTFDVQRTNLREYKIYVYLKTLTAGDPKNGVPIWESYATTALHWPVDCRNPNAGGTFLQGRLGLQGWLAPAVRTEENTIQFAPLNAPPAAAASGGTAPTISDVYPSDAGANDTIYVTGANFGSSPTVLVGPAGSRGTPATINKSDTLYSPTNLPVRVPANLQINSGEDAEVIVKTSAGFATAKFKFLREKNNAVAAARPALGSGSGGQSTGSQQSPTLSGTFTFVIKATGTIGPSFTLTRVSGGSSSLFSLIRTDNNYVNLVLTPATYCPIIPGSPSAVAQGCPKTGVANQPPSGVDLQAAFGRIDATLLNLNVSHLATP